MPIPPVQDRRCGYMLLGKALGNVKRRVQRSLERYFDDMLVNAPQGGYWKLAGLLDNGMLADQYFGTYDDQLSKDVMLELIQASIISEAWNAGKVAIVKW